MTSLSGLYWRYRDVVDLSRAAALRTLNSRRRPYELALVFSHMRSGSSLLTLLLASHPQVLGYGELHLRLRPRHYQAELMRKLFTERGRRFFEGRYLLDKLLHNQLMAADSVAALPGLPGKFIFLIREPRRAISSIRRLDYFAGDWETAANYYIGRVTTLATYAEAIGNPDRCQFVTYRDVSTRSRQALDALSTLLELNPPLSEDYRLDATTGQPGVGDFTDRIRSGHILPESPDKTEDATDFDFGPALAAFEESSTRLRVACRHLDDEPVLLPVAATGEEIRRPPMWLAARGFI